METFRGTPASIRDTHGEIMEWGARIHLPDTDPDDLSAIRMDARGKPVEVTTRKGKTTTSFVRQVLWAGEDKHDTGCAMLVSLEPDGPDTAAHWNGRLRDLVRQFHALKVGAKEAGFTYDKEGKYFK